MSVLGEQIEAARAAQPWGVRGRVASVRGLSIVVDDMPAGMGALVSVETIEGSMPAEVVGFTREQTIVMPLSAAGGVRAGDVVTLREARQRAMVGEGLAGRIVNGLGVPIDGGGGVGELVARALRPAPAAALSRPPIREPLRTGVRAIDLMAPMGRGQRLGVFAGAGVGKSTLLGQIARNSEAAVNVIALIGERGREVREFIEDSLGPAGLARSVVVVATGDESPPMRVRAARYACSVAEYFRESGRDVMLMMDSVTRFAHAQRQIGLSVGEPPATKGYTPSVFGELPLLLERAGKSEGGGSITGIYTVLVDGDDMTEPIADAAKGILDGHLVLSRKLAERGHFPAIDVLASISRVQDAVSDAAARAARQQVRRLMAKFAGIEELVQIGAYARGSDAEADVAIEYRRAIEELLQQSVTEKRGYAVDRETLVKLAAQSGEDLARRAASRGIGVGVGKG